MASAQLFIANNDQSAVLDILADIFGMEVDEWGTQAASEAEQDGFELDDYESALPYDPIVESLLLVADVSSDASRDLSDLRALTIELQAMRRKAKAWRDDPLQSESIWWHWNTEGESEKRSLVHRIEYSLPAGFMSVTKHDQMVVELTVVHHPAYEPLTAAIETLTTSTSDAFGHTAELPALGDIEGRISSVEIAASSGNGTAEIWMGVKPYGAGISGFINIWELESGTEYTDTSSGAVTGASGGNAITCTFATDESLTKRSLVLMRDFATTNLDHNRGTFLWLLRYKAEGDGVSYHLRLNQSHLQDKAIQPISEIYLAGEASPNWHIVPFGVATMPFGMGRDGLPVADLTFLWSGFTIDAARINGSSGDDLILDCLIPIPMAHHLHVQNAIPTVTPGYTYVKTFEDDGVMGYSTQGRNPITGFVHPSPPAPINWHTPAEGGLLVAAGTEQDGAIANLQIRLNQIPRWALFNGD